MTAEQLGLLRAAIEPARWFSGKSRGGSPTEHVSLDWYPNRDGVQVRSELVAVDYPGGDREWYHLPIVYLAEELPGSLGSTPLGFAHDATDVPAAMAAMLEAIASDASTSTYACYDRGVASLTGDLTPRRYGGEQSNTSVFFGGAAMLKVFRKLEPGRNLDIELHAALAETDSTARLYGWISASEWDLAMLVEAIKDPTDGYVLACELVGKDFSAQAAELGVALAHVHQGLSARLGVGTVAGAELSETLTARANLVTLESPELAEYLPGIKASYDKLAELELSTQRVHGDFHLGQALYTPQGWRIVDFEGEPMKTMAERRAMDSPWRDVAGLLRSIDYAAASKPELDTTMWRSATREAFLNAYCEEMDVEVSPALAAYELDKAVYEVQYELRNRPQLVHVPLSAIKQSIKEN